MWLLITISAYLLFALDNVGDKLVVSQYKTKPIVYAFYVGLLGIFTLAFIPFGVIWPGVAQILWSLFGGIFFVFALFFMYKAIFSGETSRAITIMGSSAPIFTFLLSYIFLDERLSQKQFYAFLLLVLAIIIISYERGIKSKSSKNLVIYASLAGFVFALSFVLAKYIYVEQGFISGFFWIRMGGVVTALTIFAVPLFRKLIKSDFKKPKQEKGLLLLAIQVTGGIGVLGQQYAFSLASSTIVSALQAIQYAFVFIFASLLGKKIPTLKEKMTPLLIIQKIVAIMMIALGLYFLAL